MNPHDEAQVSEWLRDGIAATKAGRRDEARELLMRVIEVHERSEQAWLWLSGVVEADEERLICLENVLTLNPDNVQAKAGLKWLRGRGLGTREQGLGIREQGLGIGDQGLEVVEDEEASGGVVPGPVGGREGDELFMTPDGCAYCGLVVEERDWRCPHCGGQLSSMQFTRGQASTTARLLSLFWVFVAAVNLVDFFLMGLFWGHPDNILNLPQAYHVYVTGPAVTGAAPVEALFEPEQWIQIVRLMLVGLALAEGLVALGLALRRPLAHTLALGLIALQIVIAVALLAMGFVGYFSTAFRGIWVIALAVSLLQTTEDFSKEEHREWLETDRSAVNETDYYARGRAYARRGMWAKALLHWQKAVAVSNVPKDSYFASMARAYAHLGRYEDALRQMDEAMHVSRAPQEWEPLRETILAAQRRAPGHHSEGRA
jgi:tetratricopeptide (TPR) repeat protein